MQLLRIITALSIIIPSSVVAVDQIACESTSDCPSGLTCVAAIDMHVKVQHCVESPACGANTAGNCPSSFACAWIPDSTCDRRKLKDDASVQAFRSSEHRRTTAVCASFGGVSGIFKCISEASCDESLNGQCTEQCGTTDNGMCNSRGTCESVDNETLGCRCHPGWTGDKCETAESDACTEDAGHCGDNGQCAGNSCICTEGWTGQQCEVAPGSATTESPNMIAVDEGINAEDDSSDSLGANVLKFLPIGLGIAGIIIIVVGVIIVRRRKTEKNTAVEDSLSGGAAATESNNVMSGMDIALPLPLPDSHSPVAETSFRATDETLTPIHDIAMF